MTKRVLGHGATCCGECAVCAPAEPIFDAAALDELLVDFEEEDK